MQGRASRLMEDSIIEGETRRLHLAYANKLKAAGGYTCYV